MFFCFSFFLLFITTMFKWQKIFFLFLQRLRTENRLLRQRIDYLEQESSALADRLIRGQVNLAQEAENCMSISHELHKLRDINSDAHRRLEEAYDTIRELSCKVGSRFIFSLISYLFVSVHLFIRLFIRSTNYLSIRLFIFLSVD